MDGSDEWVSWSGFQIVLVDAYKYGVCWYLWWTFMELQRRCWRVLVDAPFNFIKVVVYVKNIKSKTKSVFLYICLSLEEKKENVYSMRERTLTGKADLKMRYKFHYRP